MSISDSLTKLKFKFLLKPCLKALNSLVSTGYFKVAVHHNGQYTPLRILTFLKKKNPRPAGFQPLNTVFRLVFWEIPISKAQGRILPANPGERDTDLTTKHLIFL